MQSSSPDPYSSDIQSEPSSTSAGHPDEESVENSSPECSMSSSHRADRRKQRRNATVLIEWIEDHPYNPYPTKQEKQQLAYQSGMTPRQLNDWFANARRNIKRLGFEIWRKKRNGTPNSSKSTRIARVNIPPNILVGSSSTGQLPQQTGSTAPSYPTLQIPSVMYGSSALQAVIPTITPTATQPSLAYTRIGNPMGGPQGWYSAGPSYRPPPSAPVLSTPNCTCISCANRIYGSDHNTLRQQPHNSATIPLTSIPWTSQVPSGNSVSSYQFGGYNDVAELKDNVWSPQGSVDSCEDMLSLVLEPKEELVSSDCLSP